MTPYLMNTTLAHFWPADIREEETRTCQILHWQGFPSRLRSFAVRLAGFAQPQGEPQYPHRTVVAIPLC